MDANQKHEEMDAYTIAVDKLLTELVARRGSDKKVNHLKLAVLLYLRLAYQLGSEHVMRDVIDGTPTRSTNGNGHGKAVQG